MKYAVLFPAQGGTPLRPEGKSWAIVEAEGPTEAAKMACGRSTRPDDKALVIALDTDPVPVYAKVGWTE